MADAWWTRYWYFEQCIITHESDAYEHATDMNFERCIIIDDIDAWWTRSFQLFEQHIITYNELISLKHRTLVLSTADLYTLQRKFKIEILIPWYLERQSQNCNL